MQPITESGRFFIGSQQVSFYRTYLLFPNLPAFSELTRFSILSIKPELTCSYAAHAAVRLKQLNNNGKQNLANY